MWSTIFVSLSLLCLVANASSPKKAFDQAPQFTRGMSRESRGIRQKECNIYEIESFYSECDPKTNDRSLHYKYKQDSNCDDDLLPPSIFNLPCQSCGSGQYLPDGSSECLLCPAGTHSLSGYKIDQWEAWPEVIHFQTYCERNNGFDHRPQEILERECGWELNGEFIESGNVYDSENSVLEATIYLVGDGEIGFEIQVFSEIYFDSLIFFIDGVEYGRYSLVSKWTKRAFPLKAGVHRVKWVYQKDYEISELADVAQIKTIYVVGTKWPDSQCSLCTSGYYSQEGATFCSECPVNTYSNTHGVALCFPCPETHYSVSGATECVERKPCTEEDTSTFYTPCEDNSRVKYVQLNSPILCDESLFSRPKNQIVPCADCNPGYYRSEGDDNCQICPPGLYSETIGASECKACSAGTYAPKALSFTQFGTWSELDGMSSSCKGDCATKGWRLLGDDIDSGVGHGSVVEVELLLSVYLETSGMVEWSWSLFCQTYCLFEMNELLSEQKQVFSSQSSAANYISRGFFPAGSRTFQFKYIKNEPWVLDPSDDRLVIHNINVTGISSGGAIRCVDCPADSFAAVPGSEYCSLCPPGTCSEAQAKECSPCDS